MTSFFDLGLPNELAQSLEKIGFTVPTPIQAQAIPEALEGRDILGSAQTGTGKTGAFAIPMIAKLLSGGRGTALVLTPTRELAAQVMATIEQILGAKSHIKTALLIGGAPMGKQIEAIRKHPRIIVGTPGRIYDHLKSGSLILNNVDYLVLDETDRMLDMGFSIQLEKIAKYMRSERQTVMFSATLPNHIVRLSEMYLTNPVRIAVGATNRPAADIDQQVIRVSEAQKYEKLKEELSKRNGSIIIFVKTKRGADKLADKLYSEEFSAEAIHGDLRQTKRDKVIKGFRQRKHQILVATDVAARGLDIPHIEHVINFDLPQNPEDYIHRIGRTARAGAKGEAVCLVSPADGKKWQAIQRLLDPSAESSEPREPRESNRRRSSGRPSGSSDSRRGAGKPFARGRSASRSEPREYKASEGSQDKRRSYKEKDGAKSRDFVRRDSDQSQDTRRSSYKGKSDSSRKEDKFFSPRDRKDKPDSSRKEDKFFSPRDRKDKPDSSRKEDKFFSPRDRSDSSRKEGARTSRDHSERRKDTRRTGDEKFTDKKKDYRSDKPKHGTRSDNASSRPKRDGSSGAKSHSKSRNAEHSQGHQSRDKKESLGKAFTGFKKVFSRKKK